MCAALVEKLGSETKSYCQTSLIYFLIYGNDI